MDSSTHPSRDGVKALSFNDGRPFEWSAGGRPQQLGRRYAGSWTHNPFWRRADRLIAVNTHGERSGNIRHPTASHCAYGGFRARQFMTAPPRHARPDRPAFVGEGRDHLSFRPTATLVGLQLPRRESAYVFFVCRADGHNLLFHAESSTTPSIPSHYKVGFDYRTIQSIHSVCRGDGIVS